MGQFGYSYEKVFFQLEGESHIGEMHSSRSFRTRSFCVPSIPLIGSIDYDGSYLQVRGYNERGSVVLPERFVEPHRAVLEFGPNSLPLHAAALLLGIEQSSEARRLVLNPSLIAIPGIY
jgi:hypothetical protein